MADAAFAVVSPELVLVDPDLATWARSRLDEHDETLTRLAGALERDRRLQHIAPEPSGGSDEAAAFRRLAASELEDDETRGVPRVPYGLGLGLACSAALALIVAVSFAIRPAGDDRTPAAPSVAAGDAAATMTRSRHASDDTTSAAGTNSRNSSGTDIGKIAKQSPLGGVTPPSAAVSRSSQRAAKSARARMRRQSARRPPQHLVWPPAASADGYEVELYRDDVRILAVRAPTNRMTIPRTWIAGPSRLGIKLGDRLYIWPLRSGKRGNAIIDGLPIVDVP
jgi:hypothetical protein